MAYNTYIFIWSWSPLCSYKNFHCFENAFHKIVQCFCGNVCPVIPVEHLRSGTYVGRDDLALQFSSSQKGSIGLRLRLCTGLSSSSTKLIFMSLALCTGAQACWNGKVFLRSWMHSIVQNVFVC